MRLATAFVLLFWLCAASAQSIPFPGPGGGSHGIGIGTPTSFGTGGAASCTTTLTATTSAGISAGNLAVIYIGVDNTNNATISSVSDGTNTYTRANTVSVVTNFHDDIWYKSNASAVSSGATITATLSGTAGATCAYHIQTAQVSGVIASPLDQAPAGAHDSTGSVNNVTTTTATLAQANEIAFGGTAWWGGSGTQTYTGPYGIDFWGDSITVGFNASPMSLGWATLLGPALGVPTTNHGVSGDEVPDMSGHIYNATAPTIGSVHTIMIGTNDERVYCPVPCTSPASTTLQGYYFTGLQALAAYLATPTKFTGLGGGVTYTGTWTNTSPWPLGKNSTVSGSTATFSVAGPVIYIGMIQQDGSGGAFNVTVDGVLQTNPVTGTTTFTCLTTGLGPTINGVSFGAMLVRIPGLTTASHTVVITTINSGAVYLDWYASSAQPAGKSIVLVSNIIYAQAYTGGGSNANVDAFNVQLNSAMSQLAADGLNISVVNNNAVLNYSVDMDGAYHPINSGHAKLEASWQSFINAFSPPILFGKIGGTQAAGGAGTAALDYRISRDVGAVRYNPFWAANAGMTALVATFKGN